MFIESSTCTCPDFPLSVQRTFNPFTWVSRFIGYWTKTLLTLNGWSTSIEQVARNIVRFASSGEVTVEVLDEPRRGLHLVARDTGPGITDVEQALADGYSTNAGLGLGLPGARRLMDEFAVASEVGRGTTVTMTKWLQEGRR